MPSERNIFIFLFSVAVYFSVNANAQSYLTVPWSSSLNVTFGRDNIISSPPLTQGHSDFIYTTNNVPDVGYYSVIKSTNDAGHLYYSYASFTKAPEGYKMLVSYNSVVKPEILFIDTVSNLCSDCRYLFWAAINIPSNGSCLKPNLTFRVETITGALIASFETGNIGGSLTTDNFAYYPGFYDRTKAPAIPFYGVGFTKPAGISNVVLKIIPNSPPPGTFSGCRATFEVDNILLTPVGPDVLISIQDKPDAFVTGICSEGNVPLKLNSKTRAGYLEFGTPDYINYSYANTAYQWQQSLDDGYTWTDLPGETKSDISHLFNNPDTFLVRLRISDASNISNPNCSNVSNVIIVQVDKVPDSLSFTSNSPVCTDSDILLKLEGGASYKTFGPEGFFDNTPFPHVYHPLKKNSGWYYADMYTFGGCKVRDSTFVEVTGPDLKISQDTTICYGEKVQLESSGGNNYLWTPAAGLSNTHIANPVSSAQVTTRYELKVTDGSGCAAYGYVAIKLKNGLLKAGINGPGISCPDDIIQFSDSSAGKIVKWEWDMGNGFTANVKNPSVQNYFAGNSYREYNIKLITTDSSGCTSTAVHPLKAVNNCYIAVPSAFTPDGDGLNDFLYPMNAYKATGLLFVVYNRAGNLVFKTSNWLNKWDGTFKGNPQDPGSYIWMLSYTDENGKKISLKGTVVLLR